MNRLCMKFSVFSIFFGLSTIIIKLILIEVFAYLNKGYHIVNLESMQSIGAICIIIGLISLFYFYRKEVFTQGTRNKHLKNSVHNSSSISSPTTRTEDMR